MIEIILGSLISGLLGVVISTAVYVRRENRKLKLETLKKLAANRHNIYELAGALNEIFIVYNDSDKVMNALSNYHQKVVDRKNSKDELVELFKQMCIATKVSFKEANENLFLITFDRKPNSK